MAAYRCAASAGLAAATRCLRADVLSVAPLQRRWSWSEADETLNFKVKAEVNLNKLAGGVLLRCDQGLRTYLEAMGSASIYNAVKALNLVNKYITQRQQEASAAVPGTAAAHFAGGDASFRRVGFVPLFARSDEQQWMRLLVVPLSSDHRHTVPAGRDEAMMLKVSSRTDLRMLQTAILTNWKQRSIGTIGEPTLAAMGAESVAIAVKGAAFALKHRRGHQDGSRPFLLTPHMEVKVLTQGSSPTTITFLDLQQQPERRRRQPEPKTGTGEASGGGRGEASGG